MFLIGVSLLAARFTRRLRHTLRGTIDDTNQILVEPLTATFGLENRIVVDAGGERVTVGGLGAFLKDYEALDVTLRPGE